MNDTSKNIEAPKPLFKDGMAQPIFSYKECIFEKVYVEVPLDTAGDGKRDLIAVYIRRPKETLEGMKVPAVYVANPYMMECVDEVYENMHKVDKNLKSFKDENITWEDIQYKEKSYEIPEERVSRGEVKVSPTEEIKLDCIPEWYGYLNTRGFATVFSAGLGTKGSEGLNCTGSNEEKIWVIAVIEWLNGKRKAYTNLTDNIEIKAEWCTGKVAMSGKSYLGTLAIGAASTGVEGLETIIPEAAISSWYDYYRMNGVTSSPLGWQGDDADLLTAYCGSRERDEELDKKYKALLEKMVEEEERENGNYNLFWNERDYICDMKNFKASVLIVHGINDWNVKTNQCGNLWKKLKENNVPSKMILHQGEHIYIHNLEKFNFNEIVNKWLTYWLYKVENGVMEEFGEVFVQSNLDGEWKEYPNWAVENRKVLEVGDEKFFKNFHREKNYFVDTFEKYDRSKLEEWHKDIFGENSDEKILEERIFISSDELEKDIRVSGEFNVSLKGKCHLDRGVLSVAFVDIGEEKRLTPNQKVVEEKGMVLGKDIENIDILGFTFEENPTAFKVITRGHLNIQNRVSRYSKKEVVPMEEYNFEFSLIPTDYILKRGHKLALVIYGSDMELNPQHFERIKFEIDLESIKVETSFEEI